MIQGILPLYYLNCLNCLATSFFLIATYPPTLSMNLLSDFQISTLSEVRLRYLSHNSLKEILGVLNQDLITEDEDRLMDILGGSSSPCSCEKEYELVSTTKRVPCMHRAFLYGLRCYAIAFYDVHHETRALVIVATTQLEIEGSVPSYKELSIV